MSPEEEKWMGIAADIVACVHVPHFLKSTEVTRAANNDLLQIQSLIRLKSEPEYTKVASALLDSHIRHSWYLKENLVMLSVLNDDLSDREKESVQQNTVHRHQCW